MESKVSQAVNEIEEELKQDATMSHKKSDIKNPSAEDGEQEDEK